MLSINSYAWRHALSVGAAVLIAVTFNFYFKTNLFWTLLPAFLVSQTTRGTPLRQGLYFFLIILGALFAAFILTLLTAGLTYSILIIGFILTAMAIELNKPLQIKTFFLFLFFVLVLLLATLFPLQSNEGLRERIMEVTLGSAIGIFCSQLIFPLNLHHEFRQGLVPVLKKLIAYSEAISQCFLDKQESKNSLNQSKYSLELSLQISQGIYPEWVYEVGFNRGLRAGFRFFLLHIERIIELYFTLHGLAIRKIDRELLAELSPFLLRSMQKNQELITVLIDYFAKKNLKTSDSDFTSDIIQLEKKLKTIIPSSLELLDISNDYMIATAALYAIKDMRGLLLQLAMILPKEGLR